MKKILATIALTLISTTSFARSFNDIYSQEELARLLEHAPRCILNSLGAVDRSDTDFTVLTGTNNRGGREFFLEISDRSKKVKIVHLENTTLHLAGYGVRAKVDFLRTIEGNIVIGDNQTEFFLNQTSLIPGSKKIELYQSCQ